LRQKLKNIDQIENEEMTHGIIVTRDIVTVTSHCHCHVVGHQFDTWQICNFFKILKKIKKIQELVCGTPL